MPPVRSSLAKLTRPSAAGMVARARLFRSLDAARRGRLVWITGPAGAGKTSLVSSWLSARRATHLWYQLDAGDSDPAALFHFLALATQGSAAGDPADLPPLTPDRLPGLEVFTRRFFEACFGALGKSSVLVFDDCHSVASSSLFGPLLADALSVVPRGHVVVCLSREKPPQALARWTAGPGCALLGPDELRLTTEEAQAIAAASGQAGDGERLNGIVRGWPAGLRLLLRAEAGANRTNRTNGTDGTDGKLLRSSPIDHSGPIRPIPGSTLLAEEVFDFYAAEVFDKSSPAVRDFLLRTALPPHVSAEMAEALSGNVEAGQLLTWLNRHGLFTDRLEKEEPVYEYHPLFRAFLLDRGRSVISAVERAEIVRGAAQRLEEAGEVNDAATLLIEERAWPELTALVCRHAGEILGQGRFATVAAWIDAMPGSEYEADPWLLYWRGESSEVNDPAAARESFEQSYAIFRGRGDLDHAFLPLGGVLRTFFTAMADQFIDRWLSELEQLIAMRGGIPAAAEVRLIASANGPIFARPDSPVVADLVRRAEALFVRLHDTGEKLSVGVTITNYQLIVGEFSKCRALGEDLAPAIARENPWARVTFAAWFGCALWQEAAHEEAYAVLERGLKTARDHGFRNFEPFLQCHIAYTALSTGDLDGAESALQEALDVSDGTHLLELAQLRSLLGAIRMFRGELNEAIPVAQQAVSVAVGLGSTFGEATFSIQLGQMLMLAGRHEEARVSLRNALAFGRRVPSPILVFQVLLALSWSQFELHEENDALATLREAMTIGGQHNYMNAHPLWIPHVMARLCERALEAGIETEYVRRLIRKRGLVPLSTDIADWPWAVEIRALGGFTVLRDGQPIAFQKKSQRKVLDLLKAIVASPARGVGVDRLCDALWPDSEADAAKGAFDVTLHRLRKLLGDDKAIVSSSGQVCANPRLCRIDVAWFEEVAARVDALVSDRTASEDQIQQAVRNLTRAYPGHLLAGEPDEPWLLERRRYLAHLYSRSIRRLGERIERAGDPEMTTRLYDHALEIDPSDEEIYRRQIRILIKAERAGDALQMYSRCRDTLASLSGLPPSPDTQSLVRSLVPKR